MAKNSIGDAGAIALAMALQKNVNLQQLECVIMSPIPQLLQFTQHTA